MHRDKGTVECAEDAGIAPSDRESGHDAVDAGPRALSGDFPFEILKKELPGNIILYYFDIEDIASATSYLDDHVVQIFAGNESDDTPEDVKIAFANLFRSKLNDDSWLYGATAEFFVHLLLTHEGYRQDCLYRNLEEHSVKKGFDGLYSIGETIWLMESKSGWCKQGSTHYGKVITAANDLKNKVAGGCANNPWSNAYNHAAHVDVGANKSIRSQIKELQHSFERGNYRDISSFNIIPCGTLFYGGAIDSEDIDTLSKKISNYFKAREHGRVAVVCVSNAALDGFLAYLGLERNGNE